MSWQATAAMYFEIAMWLGAAVGLGMTALTGYFYIKSPDGIDRGEQ